MTVPIISTESYNEYTCLESLREKKREAVGLQELYLSYSKQDISRREIGSSPALWNYRTQSLLEPIRLKVMLIGRCVICPLAFGT